MKKLIYLLIALILTIIVGAFSVVGSQKGSLWVVDIVTRPITGLTLVGVQGSLVTGFRFEMVRWDPSITDANVETANVETANVETANVETANVNGKSKNVITLKNGSITWQFSKILTGLFTVNNVHIAEITVESTNSDQNLSDNERESNLSPRLPFLFSPIPIELESLTVQEVIFINAEEKTHTRIHQIRASGSMIGKTLRLRAIELFFKEYEIRGEGKVVTSRKYPLSVTGHISNEVEPLAVDFIAEGPLHQISTSLELSKPMKILIDLTLYPFNRDRLFTGNASVAELLNQTLFDDDADMSFRATNIEFSGTPEQVEYNLTGKINLIDKQEDNTFTANGVWTDEQEVQIQQFSLHLLQGEMNASGNLRLANGFELKSTIQWLSIHAGGLSDPLSGSAVMSLSHSESKGLSWAVEDINSGSQGTDSPLIVAGYVRGNNKLPSDMNVSLNHNGNKLLISGGLTEIKEDVKPEVKFSGFIAESYPFKVSCSGVFDDPLGWSAICKDALLITQLNNKEQTWQLNHPAQFRYSVKSKEMRVQPFCFQSGSTSMCSDTELQIEKNKDITIPVSISHIPWHWFSDYVPEGVSIQGTIGGSTKLSLPVSGVMKADLIIESDQSIVTVTHKENDTLEILVETMRVTGAWTPDNSVADITMTTDGKGRISGEIGFNSQREILGKIVMDNVDLKIFEVFLDPSDKLRGIFQANLQLSGNFAVPEVAGEFTVVRGIYETKLLPVEVRDIGLTGKFKQSKASVEGSFSTPDGIGTVGGVLDWSQSQWAAELNLNADRLILRPNKDSLIWITPTITMKAQPMHIEISGDIVVPKARIEIKSLPEVAARRSSDVIILDQKQIEETWQYITKVNVRLGRDVEFKGFGLEGGLSGQVDLHQSNDIPLSALGGIQLRDGKYTAYGQKLTVRQGGLSFAGSLDNPEIKIDAVRDDLADNVVVGLRVTGRAKEPIITLFSEPGMSGQDQLSYLLTGKLPNGEDGDTKTMLSQAAIGLSISQAEGKISKAADKIGVDDFQVGASTDGEGTGELRLSGKLNERLYVEYGLGVFDKTNSFMLRYQLKRGLYLEAVSGKVNSLDLMFTFDRD